MANNKEFKAAMMKLYTTNGESYTIELDLIETIVALKAIGFSELNEKSYSLFGKNTLERILKGEINPFRLKEV